MLWIKKTFLSNCLDVAWNIFYIYPLNTTEGPAHIVLFAPHMVFTAGFIQKLEGSAQSY